MQQNRGVSILLVTGIVIVIFLLARQYFVRIDLTEDKQFTMGKATRSILNNLEEPVNIKAYFTENLPADFERVRIDFQNLLTEYNNISKGKVEYQFINPGDDPAIEQEAIQSGVQPLLINVREKDEASQKKAFMGAIIESGGQKEIIPFIQRESAMEYDLTTAIKKVSVTDKPVLGYVQGHGEPALNQMMQVAQALSVIYALEPVDLSSEAPIADRFQALLFINPQDSIPAAHFDRLHDYLSRGGKIVAAINGVEGDLNTASGSVATHNARSWLETYGIDIEPSFVVDASCAKVTVQQQQGFFNFATQISFPFIPLVTHFTDHPATKGLEAIIFQFASPIRFIPKGELIFTHLVTSSAKSGTQAAPVFFDINKQWTEADFPLSNIPLGGVLEGAGGNPESRLVVFSDGDFIISQQGNVNNDNVSLLVNTIEWMVDKSGLSELRTKGVVYRPIKELEEGKRAFTKYLNFLLPLILVGAVGLWRAQHNRNKRMRRMQERYI